ncbi:hypothetical protein P280DRAFT_547095 [Massarina eburnea CBS 473.64]|uniref:3'-5' exonuclease domain-containing protein n=1 Tax=Massarina eburnea CBS 473.64 TaxID=1395130 RepID=A0A6A6SDN2_9PLEO|nr:hypothetical protein P280DRAFT_547095 [Massarina eburnea CBS 473.64]
MRPMMRRQYAFLALGQSAVCRYSLRSSPSFRTTPSSPAMPHATPASIAAFSSSHLATNKLSRARLGTKPGGAMEDDADIFDDLLGDEKDMSRRDAHDGPISVRRLTRRDLRQGPSAQGEYIEPLHAWHTMPYFVTLESLVGSQKKMTEVLKKSITSLQAILGTEPHQPILEASLSASIEKRIAVLDSIHRELGTSFSRTWRFKAMRVRLRSYAQLLAHKQYKGIIDDVAYAARSNELAWDLKAQQLELDAHELIDSYFGLLQNVRPSAVQENPQLYFNLSVGLHEHVEACKKLCTEMQKQEYHPRKGIWESEYDYWKRLTPIETLQRVVASSLLAANEQGGQRVNTPFDLLLPSENSLVGKTCRVLGYGDPADEDKAVMKKVDISSHAVPMFTPSPRLRVQHATPFFTEHATSGQHTVTPTNDADSTSTNQTAKSAGPSTPSSGEDNDGDASESSTPNEQNPPPSNRSNEEESDQPSDSDFESESESEAGMENEEKHTPLSYQIPPDILRAALDAPPNTRDSYWSQKLYRGPNNEKISVHYCDTLEVAERVAKRFLNAKALGFDIEWKPNAIPTFIKQNASLIQIASEDRIALFHVALFKGKTLEELVPPTLKIILESPDILKTGVAIKADFTRLDKHLGIKGRCVSELSRTHNLLEASNSTVANFRLVKLATQVEQHLQLPLYKGEPLADDPEPEEPREWAEWMKRQRVRESDWSKKLDIGQIHYAAADAYAGLRLYDVFESKRKQMKPIPPLPRLCDEDPKPAPRTPMVKKKARAAHVLRDEYARAIAETPAISPAEDQDEGTQEYKTADEELGTEEEESASAVEEQDEDSEEYAPKRRGRVNTSRTKGNAETHQTPQTHRIGRLRVSNKADPGYPTLPPLSSDEEHNSEESDAFESPVPRTSRAAKKASTPSPSPVDRDIEVDEFADPELEEALMDVEIDDNGRAVPRGVERLAEDSPSPQDESNSKPKPLSAGPVTGASEYHMGTAWAQDYLERTIPPPSSSDTNIKMASRSIRATVPPLRAYYIWHHQQMSIEDVGALLRYPPLANNTVANYILQAVQLEDLEFETERLKDALMVLSEGTRKRRWLLLCKKVGFY